MSFGSSKSASNQASTSTSTQASNSSSQALNQAYPFLQSALGDQVSSVGGSSNVIASLLGLNGSTAGADAFNQFKDSLGYQFQKDEGIKGITGTNAAKGLLGSGSALKAITSYSSNLANNYLSQYMSSVMGLGQTGLSAAGILANAGNTSNSQSVSNGSSNSNSYGTSTGKSTNFSTG